MFFLLLLFTLFMMYLMHLTRNQLIDLLEAGKPDEALRLLKLTVTESPGVTKND